MVMQEKSSDLSNENTENINPDVPKEQKEYSLESILLFFKDEIALRDKETSKNRMLFL